MALIPGTRIGLYEVAAQIGMGGMGEVYRATDTTLGRQVAIKVLPEPFAQDADRLARFEREAKTLASLNHPHIAQITYISRKRGAAGYELFARQADGGGSEDRLTATVRNLGPVTPLSYSPDGTLVFAHRGDLWSLSPSDTEPRACAPSRFNESAPAFSPDGRWLAYVSDESGRFEVYVRPFPGPGEKHPISIDGGLQPVWNRRGRELFFRNANQVMAVEVRTQPSFSASRPHALFTGPFSRGPDFNDYDISPDGESFVIVNAGEEDRPATHVNIIFNWFEELKRLVPTQLRRPS